MRRSRAERPISPRICSMVTVKESFQLGSNQPGSSNGSVAGYQDVPKLVAARGKGVDEGVGVGVDGDVDPVAGADELDGLLGGDEVAVVVVVPGHGSLMGWGAILASRLWR